MSKLFKKTCVVVAFSFGLSAGSIANITSEQQAMYEKVLDFPSLVKGGTVTPVWRQDGSSFVYLVKENGVSHFWEVDPVSGAKKPFLDADKMQTSVSKILGYPYKKEGAPFDAFMFMHGDAAIGFKIGERGFFMTLADYAITEATPEALVQLNRKQPRILSANYPRTGGAPHNYEMVSPKGDQALVVKDNNLWLRSFVDDRLSQLTDDGEDRYFWERGVWSSDGTTIAAQKTDGRSIHWMPTLHFLKRQEEIAYHPYPQAGGNAQQYELHFIDAFSGNITSVEMGIDASNLRPVGWHPNNNDFLFFWLSRDGKQLELRSTNKNTGDVTVVWAEENTKTFVMDHMQFFTALLFQPLSDGRFIISSERTGWRQLYLYGPNKNGQYKQLAQLTKGEFPVNSLVKVDEKAGFVYFTARNDFDREYDIHLMRVRLNGKGQESLTEATGNHAIQFAPSGAYYLDTHSTVSRPPVTELRRADGELVTVLEKADDSALTELGWQAPEEFKAKAADGKTDLYGVIRKPWNFDPSKKYPVIEYLYGGPQVTVVPSTFVSQSPLENLAKGLSELGFIVVTVDGRGTPGRGKAFQDVIYGTWGRNEVADHAAVLREVAKSRPYMDMDRVGIYGGSYGGYYATRALLQAPDLYKVAVAMMPATQIHSIAAPAIESYMGGRPQDEPEAYAYANNLPLVDNLQGKLLLMPGLNDINAPFSHTVQLIDALIQAGKPHDINFMPEGNHFFMYHDSTRINPFLLTTTKDYFVEHLK